MTIALPKTGTITRSILEFVSRHNGVRFTEIQKFIVERAGRDWEKRERIPVYKYNRSTHRYVANGSKQVRAYRGYWCTNLCSGPDSVCRKYLAKRDGRWYLNESTADLFRELANRTGQSGVIYSVDSITSSLASVKHDDPLGIVGPNPPSKVIGSYTDPAKLTGAQSFDPSTGVRLEFVPKVQLPLGPTLPEGSFKVREPEQSSDVELLSELRKIRALVNQKQAIVNHANEELAQALAAARTMEDKVRKALKL